MSGTFVFVKFCIGLVKIQKEKTKLERNKSQIIKLIFFPLCDFILAARV